MEGEIFIFKSLKVSNLEVLNDSLALKREVPDVEKIANNLYGINVRYRKFEKYLEDNSIIAIYSLSDNATVKYLSVDSELTLEEKRFVIAYLLGKRDCGYKFEGSTKNEIYMNGYFLEKAYIYAEDMLIPDDMLNSDLGNDFENMDVSVLAKEYLVPEIVMKDKIKRKVM